MDVEVLKSYNDFLQLDTMLCFENSGKGKLEVAAFGVKEKSEWVGRCMDYYNNRSFVKPDGSYDMKVLPYVIRDCLHNDNYTLVKVNSIEEALNVEDDAIPVFSCEFFSPKSYETGKINKTNETYSIHHFAGSWVSKTDKIHLALWRKTPDCLKKLLKKWKKN